MEEALDSLRIARRRIFSSRWRRAAKLLSKSRASTQAHLLELPPEIRLEIYKFIDPELALTNPLASPLYRLLKVCHFLRREMSSLMYIEPSFTFGDPRACGFFLTATKTHLHLLTALNLSLCGNETYVLESIFGVLASEKVPLRSLVLKLMLVLGDSNPERPPGMLESGCGGEVVLAKVKSRARRLSGSFGKDLTSMPGSTGDLDTDNPVTDTAGSGINTLTWKSTLGQMKTIRYLAIDGHPTGHWAVEFEVAILELHSRMFQVAKAEGKKVFRGPSPLPPGYTYDTYWLHNDVWIEGEEKPVAADYLRENYGPWRRRRLDMTGDE